MSRFRDQRIGRAIALAGALVVNGGIIAYLGYGDHKNPPVSSSWSVVYADLEPGPALRRPAKAESAAQVRADALHRDRSERSGNPGPDAETASDTLSLSYETAASPSIQATAVAVPTMRDRIAQSLRRRLGNCTASALLSVSERDECDQRQRVNAAPISGTGDPRRDRRLEREGARRMAAYEARREGAAGAVRPKCEDAGPVSDCGVSVQIEIFSSIDGFFPGLKRDDD